MSSRTNFFASLLAVLEKLGFKVVANCFWIEEK